MLKFVAFGDWLPDTPEYGEVALHREVNGLPLFGSYRPLLKKSVKATVADGPITGAHAHYFQQTIQAQFLRPDSDLSTTGWALPDAGTVFYSTVDEVTAADSDRFYSPGAPSGSAIRLGISDGTAPGSTSNHVVRYRYAIENYASGNWSLVTRLLDAPLSVTSITRAGATATATQTAHGYTTGTIVRIAGAAQAEYNGEVSVTVTGVDTYTYSVSGTPASPATGTITAAAVWSKDTISKAAVTSITRAGATATVTMTAAHGWATGETATIAGANQAEYNVSAVITVTGATTFTYTVSGAPASPATGTITATNGVTSGAWTSISHAVSVTEAGYMATAARWTSLQIEFTATLGGSVQLLRPTSDSSVGGWTTEAGASTGLFGSIDESVASDADYIQSAILGVGQSATYEAGLGTGIDPYASGSHVVRYRYKGTNAGLSATFTLKQGTTTIASQSHASIATSFTDGSFTLSGAEADAITDFTALKLSVTGSFPSVTTSTVPQYARPSSDVDNAALWENQAGSTTNIYQAIDESSASDADYINTPPETDAHRAGADVDYILGLGSLSDPLTNAGHIVRYRYKTSSPTSEISLYLYQGTTLIATCAENFAFSAGGFTTSTYTLSGTEADSITDYSQLRVKIRWPGGVSGSFLVSWVEFETPTPRRLQASFAEVELPSASRIGVSWNEVEIPATNTTYQSDKVILYAGTNTKLYEVNTASFTNVSIAGGYATGTVNPVSWSACTWGEDVIFTNKVDPVQVRLSGGALFSNLISAPSPAPKGRFVAVVADQVWLGDINLTSHYSDEVWWSAVGNAADFAKSPTTLADYQRLRQIPGQVMGIVGGEAATVFKRNGILRATFIGAPKVYGFSVLSANVGTPFPHSIVSWGDDIFFRGASDFYRISSGGPPQKIGDGILTKYLKDSAFSNESLLQTEPGDPRIEDQLVGGAVCGFSDLIAWTYQGKDDSSYRHSRMVFYDIKNGRWGFAKISGLNQTLLVSRPNLANADTHMLKGILGFDWDGTNTSWFTYSGDQTYSLELVSKIQNIVDGREVQINGVRPIFSIEKSQGDADALSWPEMTILIEASRDARMLTEVSTETKSTSLSSPDRFIGFHLNGEFFRFTVTCPELTTAMLREFVGLHVDYVVSGGRG